MTLFPLNLPIAVQDAIVAVFFVGAIVIFLRRRKHGRSASGDICRTCGAKDGTSKSL